MMARILAERAEKSQSTLPNIEHLINKRITLSIMFSLSILNTQNKKSHGEKTMFRWAIIFAVIALIASLLGFGGVAGLSKDFAVILLVIAVILAIVGFLSQRKSLVSLTTFTRK